MPTYQVVVLAIVQGLTEFLPVSSSAHLILIRRFFHWNELSPSQELTFDVALHAGTLIAVIIYFAGTWWRMIRAAFGANVRISAEEGQKAALSPLELSRERLLLWFLLLATIPGAIAGKLLEEVSEDYFRQHVPLIAWSMIVLAVIMWWSEIYSKYRVHLTEIGSLDALTAGVAQAFAIIPGVSRSGSTITAGLFRNMTRDAAVRFSFLLSTPIIAGAALLKGLHLRHEHFTHDMRMSMVLGIVISALVGYVAIAGFIRYLRLNTLKIFIVYRIIFGIIVLALVYRGYF